MRSLTYLLLAIALYGAGFGSGYFWANRNASLLARGTTSCLEVAEARLRRGPFLDTAVILRCGPIACIDGIIYNKCEERFSSVTLTFNLYDAEGLQVESAYGDISNLDAHGKARFGAAAISRSVRRFKLDRVEFSRP